MKYLILIFLVVAALITAGCNDTGSGVPTPTISTTPKPQIVYVTVPQTVFVTVFVTPATLSVTTSKNPSTTPTPRMTREIYQLGETASNGIVKVTINNKRFAETIMEPNEGNVGAHLGQWLILNVTIENIQSNPTKPGGFALIDLSPETNIQDAWVGKLDGDILEHDLTPRQKVTGELAFQVRENPTDLIIRYTHSGQEIMFII